MNRCNKGLCQAVGERLSKANIVESASSVHGFLSGALAINPVLPYESWFEELLSSTDNPVRENLFDALEILYQTTLCQLHADDTSLTLLLPDEEVSINAQTSALADWCHGFLYGLSVYGFDVATNDSGDIHELMRDFVEISRADVMDEESLDENSEKHSDEEDEELQSALLELIEYVSMGVMVVHTYFLEQEKAIH
jgi:uncharacterized protein